MAFANMSTRFLRSFHQALGGMKSMQIAFYEKAVDLSAAFDELVSDSFRASPPRVRKSPTTNAGVLSSLPPTSHQGEAIPLKVQTAPEFERGITPTAGMFLLSCVALTLCLAVVYLRRRSQHQHQQRATVAPTSGLHRPNFNTPTEMRLRPAGASFAIPVYFRPHLETGKASSNCRRIPTSGLPSTGAAAGDAGAMTPETQHSYGAQEICFGEATEDSVSAITDGPSEQAKGGRQARTNTHHHSLQRQRHRTRTATTAETTAKNAAAAGAGQRNQRKLSRLMLGPPGNCTSVTGELLVYALDLSSPQAETLDPAAQPGLSVTPPDKPGPAATPRDSLAAAAAAASQPIAAVASPESKSTPQSRRQSGIKVVAQPFGLGRSRSRVQQYRLWKKPRPDVAPAAPPPPPPPPTPPPPVPSCATPTEEFADALPAPPHPPVAHQTLATENGGPCSYTAPGRRARSTSPQSHSSSRHRRSARWKSETARGSRDRSQNRKPSRLIHIQAPIGHILTTTKARPRQEPTDHQGRWAGGLPRERICEIRRKSTLTNRPVTSKSPEKQVCLTPAAQLLAQGQPSLPSATKKASLQSEAHQNRLQYRLSPLKKNAMNSSHRGKENPLVSNDGRPRFKTEWPRFFSSIASKQPKKRKTHGRNSKTKSCRGSAKKEARAATSPKANAPHCVNIQTLDTEEAAMPIRPQVSPVKNSQTYSGEAFELRKTATPNLSSLSGMGAFTTYCRPGRAQQTSGQLEDKEFVHTTSDPHSAPGMHKDLSVLSSAAEIPPVPSENTSGGLAAMSPEQQRNQARHNLRFLLHTSATEPNSSSNDCSSLVTDKHKEPAETIQAAHRCKQVKDILDINSLGGKAGPKQNVGYRKGSFCKFQEIREKLKMEQKLPTYFNLGAIQGNTDVQQRQHPGRVLNTNCFSGSGKHSKAHTISLSQESRSKAFDNAFSIRLRRSEGETQTSSPPRALFEPTTKHDTRKASPLQFEMPMQEPLMNDIVHTLKPSSKSAGPSRGKKSGMGAYLDEASKFHSSVKPVTESTLRRTSSAHTHGPGPVFTKDHHGKLRANTVFRITRNRVTTLKTQQGQETSGAAEPSLLTRKQLFQRQVRVGKKDAQNCSNIPWASQRTKSRNKETFKAVNVGPNCSRLTTDCNNITKLQQQPKTFHVRRIDDADSNRLCHPVPNEDKVSCALGSTLMRMNTETDIGNPVEVDGQKNKLGLAFPDFEQCANKSVDFTSTLQFDDQNTCTMSKKLYNSSDKASEFDRDLQIPRFSTDNTEDSGELISQGVNNDSDIYVIGHNKTPICLKANLPGTNKEGSSNFVKMAPSSQYPSKTTSSTDSKKKIIHEKSRKKHFRKSKSRTSFRDSLSKIRSQDSLQTGRHSPMFRHSNQRGKACVTGEKPSRTVSISSALCQHKTLPDDRRKNLTKSPLPYCGDNAKDNYVRHYKMRKAKAPRHEPYRKPGFSRRKAISPKVHRAYQVRNRNNCSPLRKVHTMYDAPVLGNLTLASCTSHSSGTISWDSSFRNRQVHGCNTNERELYAAFKQNQESDVDSELCNFNYCGNIDGRNQNKLPETLNLTFHTDSHNNNDSGKEPVFPKKHDFVVTDQLCHSANTEQIQKNILSDVPSQTTIFKRNYKQKQDVNIANQCQATRRESPNDPVSIHSIPTTKSHMTQTEASILPSLSVAIQTSPGILAVRHRAPKRYKSHSNHLLQELLKHRARGRRFERAVKYRHPPKNRLTYYRCHPSTENWVFQQNNSISTTSLRKNLIVADNLLTEDLTVNYRRVEEKGETQQPNEKYIQGKDYAPPCHRSHGSTGDVKYGTTALDVKNPNLHIKAGQRPEVTMVIDPYKPGLDEAMRSSNLLLLGDRVTVKSISEQRRKEEDGPEHGIKSAATHAYLDNEKDVDISKSVPLSPQSNTNMTKTHAFLKPQTDTTSQGETVSSRLSELRTMCMVRPAWKNANIEEVDRRVKRALRLRKELQLSRSSGSRHNSFTVTPQSDRQVKPEKVQAMDHAYYQGTIVERQSYRFMSNTDKPRNPADHLSIGELDNRLADAGISPHSNQNITSNADDNSSMMEPDHQSDAAKPSDSFDNIRRVNDISGVKKTAGVVTQPPTVPDEWSRRDTRSHTERSVSLLDLATTTDTTMFMDRPASAHILTSQDDKARITSLKRNNFGDRCKTTPPSKMSRIGSQSLHSTSHRLVGSLVQRLPQVPLSSFVEWFIETSDPKSFATSEKSKTSSDDKTSDCKSTSVVSANVYQADITGCLRKTEIPTPKQDTTGHSKETVSWTTSNIPTPVTLEERQGAEKQDNKGCFSSDTASQFSSASLLSKQPSTIGFTQCRSTAIYAHSLLKKNKNPRGSSPQQQGKSSATDRAFTRSPKYSDSTEPLDSVSDPGTSSFCETSASQPGRRLFVESEFAKEPLELKTSESLSISIDSTDIINSHTYNCGDATSKSDKLFDTDTLFTIESSLASPERARCEDTDYNRNRKSVAEKGVETKTQESQRDGVQNVDISSTSIKLSKLENVSTSVDEESGCKSKLLFTRSQMLGIPQSSDAKTKDADSHEALTSNNKDSASTEDVLTQKRLDTKCGPCIREILMKLQHSDPDERPDWKDLQPGKVRITLRRSSDVSGIVAKFQRKSGNGKN